MRQPWGLSGPQFLAIYSIAFVVSIALLFCARQVAGRRSTTSSMPTPYQLAFLTGGTSRMLVLGIADLLATGQAHPTRDGRLTMDAGYRYRDAVERAIGWSLKETVKWSTRARRLSRDRAVRDLVGELSKAGLVWRGRYLARWLPLILLPLAVVVTGIVRLIDVGSHMDGWAVGLIAALLFSVWILLFSAPFLRKQGAWPSPSGAVLVQRVQIEHERDRDEEARQRERSEIPRAAIAVHGTSAILDLDMLRIINGPGVRADFLAAPGGNASTSPGGCGG